MIHDKDHFPGIKNLPTAHFLKLLNRNQAGGICGHHQVNPNIEKLTRFHRSELTSKTA